MFILKCMYMFKKSSEPLCITHTVEHNYISLSSTVGIGCVPTVLLGEIELCSSLCVIHKNSLLLNQHHMVDVPQN